jgi:hypothetical protein
MTLVTRTQDVRDARAQRLLVECSQRLKIETILESTCNVSYFPPPFLHNILLPKCFGSLVGDESEKIVS